MLTHDDPKIVCYACGASLYGTVHDDAITVDPCIHCITEAKAESQEIGYQLGVIDGRREHDS